ncbi:MAG: DUF4350 domain-containing protein [Dehalococcoidia bacterium]
MKNGFTGQVEVLIGTTVAIVIISALCILFFPTVQDFMIGNSLWNGLAHFSQEHKATTVDSSRELPELSQEKTFVSIPYRPYNEDELERVERFVVEGGRLLLMDDFGEGNQVLEYFGVSTRFSGDILLDPLFCYKNPQLPRVTDFADSVEQSGVQAIVLNHATVLTGTNQTQVLAWSSDKSFLDIDRDEQESNADPKGPFPIAAKLKMGEGEIILLSDPSILINSMISKDDNRLFLQHLIGYNTEEGSISVDRAHLEKSRLDESQLFLTRVQKIFSNSPAALGLVALVFVGVSRYVLWRGRRSS